MLKALSLYLPNWAVELANRRERLNPSRHGPRGEALLLTSTVHQRAIVAACCASAGAAGVVPGMSVADARALIRSGRVRIEEHRADRDEAALVSLARWAMRFTPVVATDSPDGLLLNVTGCAHLFGGEERMIRRVVRGAARLGFTARGVIAPTYAGARALSRFAEKVVCVPDCAALRGALAPLPVGALRIEPSVVSALREVGIERIGQLLAISRRTIPSRFGVSVLCRMDEAVGTAPEVIEPVRERVLPRAERCLDGPTVNLEVLAIVTKKLLEEILVMLVTGCAGVRRLDAVFERPGHAQLTMTLRLSRPTRELRHLWAMLWPRMERMHLGDGVERVELIASRVGRVREAQLSQWSVAVDDDPNAHRFDELCETLANRLGGDRVLRARLIDTHMPERAAVFVPVFVSVLASPQRSERALDAAADRPSVLLDIPEVFPIVSPAGSPSMPSAIVSRGRTCPLVRVIGPERLAAEWWVGPASTRDYFKVQDDSGRWLWVFHDARAARWYLHGLWA